LTRTEKWTAVFTTSGNFYDQAGAIALSAEGNVIVTGTTYRARTDVTDGSYQVDALTLAFNPNNGSLLWQNTFGAQNIDERPVDSSFGDSMIITPGFIHVLCESPSGALIRINSLTGQTVYGNRAVSGYGFALAPNNQAIVSSPFSGTKRVNLVDGRIIWSVATGGSSIARRVTVSGTWGSFYFLFFSPSSFLAFFLSYNRTWI
jgi:outer membrane protein assembly factor BamB